MSFRLSITAEIGRAYVPFLRKHVKAAMPIAARLSRKPLLEELSLALVGDRRMSALHRQFMGINGPTDVLTFPIDQNRRGQVRSGEVIICVPQARREAKKNRVPLTSELLLYAVHGMLHLLGYDDRTDRAFHTMHRTEDSILTELGLAPALVAAKAGAPR